jgi:hypothetical protein
VDQVIIKFESDISGLKPAVDAMLLLGKITDEDARKISAINSEQQEFLSTLNKTTTEAGKLTTEMEDLKKVIQDEVMAGMAEGIADWAAESKNAVKGAQSLKAELRELKKQIASGAFKGDELKQMTKRAAELTDHLGDVNDKIKALASDTKRIDAVVTTFRGLAAATSVVTGAMGLLGTENKDLEKQLLKVQSAMAILNGVQEVATLITTENAAKTLILDGAQKAVAVSARVMGTSIATASAVATGGLTLLIGAIAYLIVTMDDARESATDMDKALAGDADARKDAVDMRLKIMKEGIDKEKLMLRLQLMEDEAALDKQFRNKEISQAAWNAKHAAMTDKYFFDLQAISDKYAKQEADKDKKENEERLKRVKDLYDKEAKLLQEWRDRRQQMMEEMKQAAIDMEMAEVEDKINARKKDDADFDQRMLDRMAKQKAANDAELAALMALMTKTTAVRKTTEKEWAAYAIQQAEVVANAAFQINSNLRQAETNNLLDSLNTQRDAELSNKELTDAQKIQIEKRYQQQEAKIKEQAYLAQRNADIAQAIINGALAVGKTLAQLGFTPAGLAASVAAGVTTAAQIAIIQSAPIPKFEKGGLVDGQLHSQGGTIIEAEKGEYVINRHSTTDYYPVIDAINNNAIDPTLANNVITQLAMGLTPQPNGGYEIDYNKLAQVFERGKSKVYINIDENGFTNRTERAGGTLSFRNSKLRMKV